MLNLNEIVYVKEVGYGVVVNCGMAKPPIEKIDRVPSKRQSFCFDPDMFNSDPDLKTVETTEEKPIQISAKLKSEEQNLSLSQIEQQPVMAATHSDEINIVQVRLEGTQTIVYTQEKNVSKSLCLLVKPFIAGRQKMLSLAIEITKSVDTLKKSILQELGEPVSNYYNVKLFNTSSMSELNVGSKTISQLGLKDRSKLILTAELTYTFQNLVSPPSQPFKLILSNPNTIQSIKVVVLQPLFTEVKPETIPESNVEDKKLEEPKAENAPNAPDKEKVENIIQNTTKIAEVSPEPKTTEKVSTVAKVVEKGDEAKEEESSPYHAICTPSFISGKHYWELKLEKIPAKEGDLIFGVQSKNELWGVAAASGSKVTMLRQQAGKWSSSYFLGYSSQWKVGEILGVMVGIKGRKADLSFYRNGVWQGEAFSIEMKETDCLTAVVVVGGEAQVTLESKSDFPLHSYRER